MSSKDSNLERSLSLAAGKLRWQRVASFLGIAFRWSALVLGLGLVSSFALRSPGLAVIVLGITALALIVVSIAALVLPLDPNALAREMDRRFRLPDHTTTAEELQTASGQGWHKLQYEDTVARLGEADWKKSWKIALPKFSLPASLANAVLAMALITLCFVTFDPSESAKTPAAPPENAAQLEEIFKDWETAAEQTDNPELRQLLAELKPMREELPKMSDRELLSAMSKLENKLESLRQSAEKESLEPSANDIAEALANMEGQEATSAALRRKDFKKAAELADQSAKQMAKKGAATPKGADSPEAQQQFQKTARKLSKSGQQQASSAMNQMAQSGQKKDSDGMSKGMGQLGQSLSKESSRKESQSRLGTQLSQLGQCKSNMANGESNGSGMSLIPKLAGKPGGKGAGSDSDYNRTKAATDLGSNRIAQDLSGAPDQGDSEVETVKSDAPSSEAPRADRATQFAQYEKLSEQAIADESMPLAYREAIRRYFESIRPSTEN